MRILIHGLNYWPELIGIGKYTGEMARWLAERGHEVRVVTAYPYYPQWRVPEGYDGRRYRREQVDGVAVHHCPVWVPRRPGSWRRLVHLLSFAASSAPVAMWLGATWRPDIVFAVEPTLLAAPAALAAARLAGALSWIHVQDFEVEAAFAVGLMNGDRLRRRAVGVEALVLRRFDRASTISPSMCERLRGKGIAEGKIKYLPNWAAAEEIHPLPEPSPMRQELGIAAAAIVALYAGNMSEKQGLDTLVEAAARLRHDPRIAFVFAGEGAARRRLEELAGGLANIRFLPLQPQERLNDLLNLADIHLLPQRRGVADLVMPSKLLGMMASGRPIVAGADPAAALGAVVAGCGVVVPPEDGRAMAEAVAALAGEPERRSALGAAGRQRAVLEWGRETILLQLERWLEEGVRPRAVVTAAGSWKAAVRK